MENYTLLTTSSSVTMPNVPNVAGHAMYDTWLTEPTSSNAYDYEVMFQYDHVNDGTCPATGVNNGTKWNWGVVATDVVIDGTPWFLCDGQVDRAGGVCPSLVPVSGLGSGRVPVLTRERKLRHHRSQGHVPVARDPRPAGADLPVHHAGQHDLIH